uniref:Rhodanese domain-containing protein n=1 Tax=Trichuris muris TaxID=70415 RepID=A0A5S6PYZ6_TRIMR
MLSVTCRTGCLRRFPLILQAISASHSSFNRLRGKQFGEVLYSASRQLAPRSHFKPIFNVSLSTSAQYENAVSYEELKALIEAHDVLLIDVRDPEEITNQGRIIDAVNIPLGQLPEAFEMDDESFFKKYKFEKPHKFDANVVFHGLSHIKSTAAVEIAHRHGFTKTRHFPGGWEEWIRQEKS